MILLNSDWRIFGACRVSDDIVEWWGVKKVNALLGVGSEGCQKNFGKKWEGLGN